jgi:asparagine synthase (glutamine-hydrolysing)
MCGIYGINKKINASNVREKLSTILFRGPDFSGIQITDNFSFGHNRLAIIDLDQRSNQPLQSDGFSIVFNGEIYNYQSIRKKLLMKGHHFLTDSDTEVIIKSYMEYGENCLDHFNGMFAFVIYDPKKNIFFGARDRMGKKPFYYYKKDNTFEFASQIKQLRFDKHLEIDRNAQKLYFRYGYIPEPYSIYQNIYKLEAGHCFTYNLKTHQFVKKQYWDISTVPDTLHTPYADIKKELKHLLIDSVDIRLHADVPVGVFLSGGVDSSLVASITSKELGNTIDTFSIKFTEAEFDESMYAQQVADELGTNHHTLTCSHHDMIALIENLNEYYDEPYNDSSALPMIILSRETRKHVTVALSGDGGDELFWGYHNYFRMKRVSKLYKLPKFIRTLLSNALEKSSNYRLKKIAQGLKIDSLEELFLYSGRLFDFEELFGIENITYLEQYKQYLFNQKSLFERISDYDIKTYMNGDIFTKVDRATMAYSLEARTPLVDYRIVELSQKIPFEYKYKNGEGKYILKDVLYDYLPKEIFQRPKSGFTVPLKNWFRAELKEYVYDTLTKENLQKIDHINIDYVQQIIDEHMHSKANYYHQIWSLISYVKWDEKYGN